VPAQTPADEALAMKPDGVFLSNGTGDPEPCDYAITAISRLLDVGVPTFGICLGHQLLGLALGCETYKMPFGHHGANHPVRNLGTGHIEITSQNHGFAIAEDTLTDRVELTHRNLYDGTVEGIASRELRAWSVQYHPESSPGPRDSGYLFEEFVESISEKARA
jgi:carbamoyl-phosphate synthase small subunit